MKKHEYEIWIRLGGGGGCPDTMYYCESIWSWTTPSLITDNWMNGNANNILTNYQKYINALLMT